MPATPPPDDSGFGAGVDPATTGLVLVDHGSRRTESNRLHERVVRDWQGQSGYPIVQPAHMELAEPSIADAFDACVDQGATTVVVAPWFLGPGRHWDRDIPELAAAAAARHPGVRHLVTAPLGPHPLLFAIVEERVRQCLAHATADAAECDLCAGTGRCHLV
jgi:sirohydrochlorin ferrochelatase